MHRKIIIISVFLVALFISAIYAYEVGPEQIKWAAGKAAGINKLQLKENVKTLYVEDKDELIEVLRKEFRKEYPEKRYEALEQISRKIGFYFKKVETEEELLQSEAEAIAGLYDDEEKAIYIVTSSLAEQLQDELADSLERKCGYVARVYDDPVWEDWYRKHGTDFTLVHEVTHAIQDQHYDLMEWKNQYETNTDALLAIKSVIEGTAEYTERGYLYGQFGIDMNDLVDVYEILELIRNGEEQEGAFFPQNACNEDVTYQYRLGTFPYIYGLALVQRRNRKGGWNAVHDMHYNSPLSTEQVIHPDKYFDPKKIDWPTFITPPDLSRILPESYSFLDTDSMGEYRINLLLLDLIFEARDAIRISEGWDGDRYMAFENADDGGIAFIWLTVWDNGSEAAEFFEFYKNIINRKEIAGNVILSGNDRYLFDSGGQLAYMELRGDLALVIEGVNDRDLINKVADAMFGADIHEATYDDYEVLPDYYKNASADK